MKIKRENYGVQLDWRDGAGERRTLQLTHYDLAKISIVSNIKDFFNALAHELGNVDWKARVATIGRDN